MTGPWSLALKNIFMPAFCKQCGERLLTEENGYFCPACWAESPRIHRPFCSTCGRPHGGRVGMGAAENFPCAGCRDAGPRAYRRIYAAAHYEGAIAEAIKMLKFHDRRRIANALAELMAEFAEREMPYEFYDDLVPVPLHRVRIRGRGFNQAELLAVRLLPQFPNAKMSEALRRIRPTRVQSRIEDRVERVRNVAGAFAVDRDVNLEGRTILLIDDVSTTGGTVNECAAALKRAGAHEVDVLVAAAPVEGGPGRSLLPASVGMGRMRATGGKRDD